MKDPFSIRITFSESAREFAEEFINFIEDHVEGLNIGKPSKGNNPKYKVGGDKYDPEQGEFHLAYSRLNIKRGVPQLPRLPEEPELKTEVEPQKQLKR